MLCVDFCILPRHFVFWDTLSLDYEERRLAFAVDKVERGLGSEHLIAFATSAASTAGSASPF